MEVLSLSESYRMCSIVLFIIVFVLPLVFLAYDPITKLLFLKGTWCIVLSILPRLFYDSNALIGDASSFWPLAPFLRGLCDY